MIDLLQTETIGVSARRDHFMYAPYWPPHLVVADLPDPMLDCSSRGVGVRSKVVVVMWIEMV